MSAAIRFLLIGGSPTSNLLNSYLSDYGGTELYSGSQDPSNFALLVVNCASEQPNDVAGYLTLLEAATDHDVPILLLDETDDHKEAIAPLTGFSTSGSNLARFVYPVHDQHQRRHLAFIEQFYPTRPDGQLVAVEVGHDISDAEPVEINTSGLEEPEPQPDHVVAFVDDVTNVLRTIHERNAVYAVVVPPAGCPYWAAPNKVYKPFSVGGYSGSPSGTVTLSGTSEVGIYYDNLTYSNPVQWTYLSNTGNFVANMVQNSSSQKGWAVGGLEIDGTDLASQSGFSLYDSSPKSINGKTDYTSSVSFTVGVEAGTDGLKSNASYTEGSSVTNSLSDWLITLTGDSNWNYVQQVPYNGESQSFPSGAVTSSGTAAGLPAISTSSLSYDSQVVYQANPPLSTSKSLSWAFTAFPTYLLLSKTGSCWSGTFYYYSGWTWTLPYTASFGGALPTS